MTTLTPTPTPTLVLHRSEFFSRAQGRALAFRTHWPPEAHGPKTRDCGCTKTTETRPLGFAATSATQALLTWEIDGTHVVYSTDYPGFCLYPGPPQEPTGHGPKDEHLYVWRNDNRFQIQYSQAQPPGRLPDNWWRNSSLMVKLFIGPPSDEHRNKLYNGHSPTRLDLGRIPYGRVWLHDCEWGKEATAEITGPEAGLWRKCYFAMHKAQRGLFSADDTTPLSELHVKILASDTVALLTPQAEVLAELLRGITLSETWKMGKQIEAQTRG